MGNASVENASWFLVEMLLVLLAHGQRCKEDHSCVARSRAVIAMIDGRNAGYGPAPSWLSIGLLVPPHPSRRTGCRCEVSAQRRLARFLDQVQ